MGLDVYVGSLTKYYANAWETVGQKAARGTGLPTLVIKLPQGGMGDPRQIRPTIMAWQQTLASALKTPGVTWDETGSEYFTDKPDERPYACLLLWAAYAEHPELTRPLHLPKGDWKQDTAFSLAQGDAAASRYSQLLRSVSMWLPVEFEAPVRVPGPQGAPLELGSGPTLLKQLHALNEATWKAQQADVDLWSARAPTDDAALESAARFGFAIMLMLTSKAVKHRLPMVLAH